MQEKRVHRRARVVRAALLLVTLAAIGPVWSTLGWAESLDDGPRTHVVLINGGQNPNNNALSHLHHLQDMVETLTRRGIPPSRIHVFSSDGEDPGNDLLVRGSHDPRLWLLEGTPTGRLLRRAEVTNTLWDEVELRPAKLAELRKWFVEISPGLVAGDTVMIFVTDHGTRDKEDAGNNQISLWNESLSVLEFRALIGHLSPGVQVVNVMSQCFSGGFADAMTPFHDPTPTGNVCGFYSTTADRLAYGCYPEGRDRDRIGHAFRFIDAMERSATLDDAHLEVLLTDATPDVPVRTSDVYYERLLQDEAGRRESTTDEVVSELLREAWKDRGRWEPQIRLLDRLGSVYGIFSPRTPDELATHIEGLKALSEELETYRDRWRLALNDLKADNLSQFKTAHPEWTERLDRKKLEGMNEKARQELAGELLPVYEEFTAGRGEVQERLEKLRATYEDAQSAEFRVEIRLAALLRMRSVLIGVAARQMMDQGTRQGDEAMRQAAAAATALERCEALQIGSFDTADSPALVLEPLPPYEEDLAVVERVLPSWIGIRFQPVPERQRENLELQRGAILVQQVYEDSAAAGAGLQPGDLVLGPPDQHFDEPRRIREWVMSSPQHTPLQLAVLREGKPMEVTASLGPYPIEVPQLPSPPDEGDAAPGLPEVTVVSGPPELERQVDGRHVIFFWATWCGPCKKALPELMAWSDSNGVPILAVSDENPETVGSFLEDWTAGFPDSVVTDEYRVSYIRYGVSGTPTFVIVDDDGKIEWRQTGYSVQRGLGIEGWDWED